MISVTFILLAIFLLLLLLRRRWERFQFFKTRGIPGPPPHLLWGHYRELRSDHIYWINKWSSEYGSPFGIFWGDKPFLVTRDVNIAKEVLIKQFSKFTNRGKQFALEDSHPVTGGMVAFCDDTKWKSIRSTMSPGFTSKKIKQMTPLILKSVQGLEQSFMRLSSKPNASDIYPLMKRFSIENIGRTIFGINVKTQTEENLTNPLLKAALQAPGAFMKSFPDLVCNSFESLNPVFGVIIHVLFRLKVVTHAISNMVDEMDKIIKVRKSTFPQSDLLQNLLDAQEVSTDIDSLTARADIDVEEKKASRTVIRQLTTEQVVGNAITLYLAGYDTTSSSLASVIHCLGKYPDVQKRLRDEIQETLQGNTEPTYDDTVQLKYMDRVIQETLRILPPVTGFTTRRALTDVEICGTKYPRGLTFFFPTQQIHLDPSYWKDPLTFNPDRFLQPLEHPLAFQPFGAGPRNCLGMRIALATLKLALCRIVPKFDFTSEDEMKVRGVMIVAQPDRVMVKVKVHKDQADC